MESQPQSSTYMIQVTCAMTGPPRAAIASKGAIKGRQVEPFRIFFFLSRDSFINLPLLPETVDREMLADQPELNEESH
jgi:hypothetical protein